MFGVLMKKIAHYLLLAAVLIGLPLGCAWIAGYDAVLADVRAFPPQCEEWMQMPERLWRLKCQFNWWVFIAMGIFVAAAVYPFAVRFIKALSQKRVAPIPHRFPTFGWVGIVVMVMGWIIAWNRFEVCRPIQRYPYVLQWGGFILLVNALCVKRSGLSPLTARTRSYLLLFPASSLFWWFFEYLNRYVWNWFYVGIPGISTLEYAILSSICFASVLPGVVAVANFLGTFKTFDDSVYSGMAKVCIRSKTSIVTLSVLTLVGLTGIVFFPQFAYPLLWISPLMGFVLIQILFKEQCELDVLADGNWGVVFRFAIAALICGLVWETWNFYSLAKWIYNVPYVERFKVWEMPLMGFGGYLPFGMECAVIAAWIDKKLIRQ